MVRHVGVGLAVLVLAGVAFFQTPRVSVAGEAGTAETKGAAVDNQAGNPEKVKLPETGKVLVVVYSRSGNTRAIAELIQRKLGAVTFEIRTATPYPEDYHATTEQAKRELNDGYLPPLKAVIENLDAFDTVFIGSPNWWSTIAPPVMTFLARHDLSGKTVVPFFTHGGGGMARCAEEVKKRCPNSTVLEARAFSGSNAKNAGKQVDEWVDRLALGGK